MNFIRYYLLPLAISLSIVSAPITEPVNSSPHITVMLGGDTLIIGGVKNALVREGYDAVISSALAKKFREADIAMLNLEMAVSDRGEPMEDKEYTFRASPTHLDLLEHMGVNAVSVANNHTMDYGETAFLDTLKHLSNAGIAAVGGGKNLEEASAFHVFEVQERKVGILAASRVVPSVSWYARNNKPGMLTTYDPALLNSAIGEAKEVCDFVIVYVHWGVERNTEPEPYQRQLARGYIDAGADAVIGTHPHVPQGFEIYKDKPIAYSLGNFIFTSSHPDTLAVRLNLTDDEIWMEVLPCRIVSPYVSLTEEQDKIASALKKLENISFDVVIDKDGRVRSKTDADTSR
ncbi:MAG: CapA family protein [Oscillospiraceae bacterium]|nr:CapA family protein [Oscillospiraceae bacterium]